MLAPAENVRKHPYYELTQGDRNTLMGVLTILMTMHDILHGGDDEGT